MGGGLPPPTPSPARSAPPPSHIPQFHLADFFFTHSHPCPVEAGQPDPSASIWVRSQATNAWSSPVEADRNVPHSFHKFCYNINLFCTIILNVTKAAGGFAGLRHADTATRTWLEDLEIDI